jgi:hypothetical protein
MLQIIVSDYNRQPTQRDVLTDDRLPTHHTYRNRFGTLREALELAGMGAVPKTKSSTHDAIRDILTECGLEVVGEWVPVGSILIDFEVRHGGATHLIDLVDIKEFISSDTYDWIVQTRQNVALAHRGDRGYLMVTGCIDAMKHAARIAG